MDDAGEAEKVDFPLESTGLNELRGEIAPRVASRCVSGSIYDSPSSRHHLSHLELNRLHLTFATTQSQAY